MAVIDVGIDYDDPVIAYKTDRNEVGLDLVENDYTPSPLGKFNFGLVGSMGHGSHVSGIAVRGNDKLELIAIRHDVSKSNADVEAIEYAAKRGARVVNMSFGGDDAKQAEPTCEVMRKYPKILFVAAVDNSGSDNDQHPFFPAGCGLPNSISVGSVNGFGTKSGFSGYGRNSVDIAAKGENVESTIGYGATKKMSGNSMAAPQVSNVAAKILVINPRLSPMEVIDIIKNSASTRFWLKKDFKSGGYLDESAALALARETLK